MATRGTEYEVSREGEGPKSVLASELCEEKISPNLEEAPDGGPRAWLVATGRLSSSSQL
jgi:hypothetical protein